MYITFESALQILAVAYMVPALVLVAASTVGLAVIETVEDLT